MSVTARKFFGCFNRRERWGLSLRGWCGLLAMTGIVGVTWVLNVHSFLAHTERVDTKILVVEGWAQEYVMRAAIAEFNAGHYEKVYTTGCPIPGTDGDVNDTNTFACQGAQLLVRCGLPGNRIEMVPSHVKVRDRTYGSAMALRAYFQSHGAAGKASIYSPRMRMRAVLGYYLIKSLEQTPPSA